MIYSVKQSNLERETMKTVFTVLVLMFAIGNVAHGMVGSTSMAIIASDLADLDLRPPVGPSILDR